MLMLGCALCTTMHNNNNKTTKVQQLVQGQGEILTAPRTEPWPPGSIEA